MRPDEEDSYPEILPGLARALEVVEPRSERVVQTPEQLERLIDKLRLARRIALDTETTSLHLQELKLVGISLALSAEEAYYIPINHNLGLQLDTQEVLSKLKPVLERPDKTIYFHHAKYDIGVLRKYNINIPMIFEKEFYSIEDSMIMAWLLDETMPKNLKKLARIYLGMQMTEFDSLFGKKKARGLEEDNNNGMALSVLDELRAEDLVDEKLDKDFSKDFARLAIPVAADYACDDALATYKLCEVLKPKILQEGFQKAYFRELALTPCMVNLSFNGVLVDRAKALEKYKQALAEMREYELRAKDLLLTVPEIKARYLSISQKTKDRKLRGVTDLRAFINFNSTPQRAAIFYEDLKLADSSTKKTKAGNYSTDRHSLNALVRRSRRPEASPREKLGGEVAELLLKYMKANKLVTAFLKPMEEQLRQGRGKIYCFFNNVGTRTGRFSSSSPNLQQVPRDSKNSRFREIFIAPEGYDWVSVDLSQIELRLTAHFSQDKNMLEAYRRGEDIHSTTARLMSGKSPEDCEGGAEGKEWKTIRTFAKTINFGIIYGMSGQKLYETLINEYDIPEDSITVEECNEKIEKFFESYPGVRRFIERQKSIATSLGFVTTLNGRLRRLPEALEKPPKFPLPGQSLEELKRLKAKYYGALRIAVNSPVQGSAGDMVKYMMVVINNSIEKDRRWDVGDRRCQMISQVHDELNFYCPKETSKEFKTYVEKVMARTGEVYKLSVPILGEGACGPSWSEAK
jgi:DNA polymerase-1